MNDLWFRLLVKRLFIPKNLSFDKKQLCLLILPLKWLKCYVGGADGDSSVCLD